jgi:hypothetical protein
MQPCPKALAHIDVHAHIPQVICQVGCASTELACCASHVHNMETMEKRAPPSSPPIPYYIVDSRAWRCRSQVLSLNTHVVDGNRPLSHRARHRALGQKASLQCDMILQHRCLHSGAHPLCPRRHLTGEQHLSAPLNSVQWPPTQPLWFLRVSAELSYLPDPDLDCGRDSDDAITLVPSLRCRSSSGSGSRNHTRGETIELSHAPGVKCTPPSSPFNSSAPLPLPLSAPMSAHPQAQPMVRFNLFPPHSSPKRQLQTQTQTQTPDSYEEGTPSITSSSSSRSPSPSPSLSPAEPVSPTRLLPPGLDMDGKNDASIHHLDYNNFVNRYVYLFNWTIYLDIYSFFHSYCFYTGSGPDRMLEHPDFIPRSLSASSVEEFLSTSHLPPLCGTPYSSNSPFATPRAHGIASDWSHGTYTPFLFFFPFLHALPPNFQASAPGIASSTSVP